MQIINEEDLITRLIDILNTKKTTYQKIISEQKKIIEIRELFKKYPEDPMKSLIELADSKLQNLLLEFLDLNITINDLKIKKYWMNEGYNNLVLQSSKQYKEVKKIFEELIDKIQSYLDYSSNYIIDSEMILEKLNTVTLLNNKLINNTPISDLNNYSNILTVCETFTENDLFNYLMAISINNINLIKNLQYDNSEIIIDNEFKSSLIIFIESLISEKKISEKNNDKYVKKINATEELLNKIDNNYDNLLNVYPNEIQNTLSGLWEDKDIQYFIDSLALPVTIIKGNTKGLKLELSIQDKKIINKFINCIKNRLISLKEEAELYSTSNNHKNSNEIDNLEGFLIKLKTTSNSLFEYVDFITIINLLKDNNQTNQFIFNTINLFNQINLKKYSNISNDNQISLKNDSKTYANNNFFTIEKIEKMFIKYGFNYNSFPEILIQEIYKNGNYENVEQLLDYINNRYELTFSKDYTLPIGSSDISKRIQEIKCSQLCFILVYSNIEILNSLIDIAQEDGIELKDIFSIPKVFASKENEKLKGTYENFIINEKFIKKEYPNILKIIMERYPFVLGVDSNLFRKNVELTETYCMSIEKDSNDCFPSPLALVSKSFEFVMDRYIEANSYDYIECFRYHIENNPIELLKKKYMDMKKININYSGTLIQDKYFVFDFAKYLNDLTMENIPVAINNKLIRWLDSINEEKDEKKKNIQYKFNNIYISRMKVLKYYSTLLINKYPDKYEALLYSLTKDSYLNEKEFLYLKKLVYKGDE